MKTKILLIIILGVFLISFVSAGNLNLFPNPNEPNVHIAYVFNFSNGTTCDSANIILSHNETVITNPRGFGYVSIDISSLPSVPLRLCEYKDGALRKNHSLSSIVFENIYAQNLNLSENAKVGGNITADYLNATDYYTYDDHVGEISLKEIGHDVIIMNDDILIHNTNLSITAVGGVITATVRNVDDIGGNIDYIVNKTKYSIADVSSVTLTAGTWVNPTTNYLWVDTDEALESSTVAPTGEFAWVGIVEVANVTGAVVNYYAVQDEIPTLYELVKQNYERAWYDNVLYESGIAITFTGEEMSTTSGNLRFALTTVPFKVRDTTGTTKFIWINDPDGAYSIHDDLDAIAKYQSGEAIVINKYFNVVIFGLVEDESNDYYYVSVQDKPTSECTSVSCAESDTTHKTNYNFPTGYERTGFRIARIVLKHTAGDNTIQTLSNGLNYIQLLDETQIIFGGSSSMNPTEIFVWSS